MERGTAGVLIVDPAVGRPGEKVGDEKGHAWVGPNRVESRIGLDAVELDEVVRLHEREDADLRVAFGRAGDQRPMPHLGDKAFGGRLVGRIVGARKHVAKSGALGASGVRRRARGRRDPDAIGTSPPKPTPGAPPDNPRRWPQKKTTTPNNNTTDQ